MTTNELKLIVDEIIENCKKMKHGADGQLCHQCAQSIHIVATHITPAPTPQPISKTRIKLEKRFGFKRN